MTKAESRALAKRRARTCVCGHQAMHHGIGGNCLVRTKVYGFNDEELMAFACECDSFQRPVVRAKPKRVRL